MACSGGVCQSDCYKNDIDNGGQAATDTVITKSANDKEEEKKSGVCVKCKTNGTISSESDGKEKCFLDSDDAQRFCGDCFRSNLYGKCRLAVSSHAMITPSDNVLVAFSGGPASRVALQFVHEMQQRAQKNFDASKDRSLPIFGVGVAFIDESAVHTVPSRDVDKAICDMRLIVSNLAPPKKQFHVVPIESVYESTSSDGKDRIFELLHSVNDATGKEDLLLYMRMLALQKVAAENGYNRLILGSCTSMIACHVIAATVKGKGYSLSADIHYVDARREIPVMLPLRDCTAQELSLLCHLDGLETLRLVNGSSSTINSLVSSFVSLLQEENPSRECTIVRTAAKLTPFHFNRIPEIDGCKVPLATRRRQKRDSLNPKESISTGLFCLICNSPVSSSDLLILAPESCKSSLVDSSCCSSCRFQILPKDPAFMEHFTQLLPPRLITRANHENSASLSLLRERIQDCLLSDSEEVI